MATPDILLKWKDNKDTDTVFFGDTHRDEVVQKVRDRVKRQKSEFTDNEWNINDRTKIALYKDGKQSHTDKYKPAENYRNRILSKGKQFYAKEKGLTSPDDVDQGNCSQKSSYTVMMLSKAST